ncbi:helix-turn-helix domain-containing protein [Rothia aeria]|uniref:helix-turn-helix domain-containing protein n=1 Tax=Rothia aeria TaxID=172042 RepID=UPI00068C5B14|nr:helix-turn-helix domain-containing protein [Rothia aeria]
MLVSVWSDKFRNNGQVRPPIMFHPGLNTVRGGQSAQNSIGKSTLLFIVDYAFGGSTFAKSKAVSAKAEGAHTIYFTFRFNDVDYYFSRTTNVPGFVQTYEDPEYKNPAERWEFDEYVGWLKHQYGLSGMDASFRQIVTRFARIQQKALSNVETPLQGPGREPVATGLAVMRQLFAGSIAKLGKDENITTDVLIKICNALDCDLFDILETIPTDNAQDVTALEQQGEADGR